MHKNDDAGCAILFVDDEEKTRKYFARAFSGEFRIFTASGVTSARELLLQHGSEIGVLISDQRMPEEKGVVLLHHAREHYPHIVRILTTAYSDLDDAIESVNSGEILRYITKPWDLKLLGSELRHAMRYFRLQRERDRLMDEKLSVQQRLMEVNRARDLIVMAGSFSHVRHPLQAIRSFLLHLPVKGPPTADKPMDRWQLLEEQLQWILETAKTVIERTANREMAFEPVDIVGLWGEITDSTPNPVPILTNFAPDLPEVKVQIPLISELLRLLADVQWSLAQGSAGADIELSAMGTYDADGRKDGIKIIFSNPSASLGDVSSLTSSVDLLCAFFIAHHHGGILEVWDDEGVSFELSLPLDAAIAELPAPEFFWLDELFARFEQWGA